jgi:hypothetical protein
VKYTEQDFCGALENLGLSQDGPIGIGYLEATVTGPARTSSGERVWVRVGTVAALNPSKKHPESCREGFPCPR